MNLDELGAQINQNEKQKEVTNADMLASLVLIQSHLQKIEKIINENQKIHQKSIDNIINILQKHDKNISAIPVLTANIITDKVNDVATNVNNGTDNIATATKALNESNSAFRFFLHVWLASLALFLLITLFLIYWR